MKLLPKICVIAVCLTLILNVVHPYDPLSKTGEKNENGEMGRTSARVEVIKGLIESVRNGYSTIRDEILSIRNLDDLRRMKDFIALYMQTYYGEEDPEFEEEFEELIAEVSGQSFDEFVANLDVVEVPDYDDYVNITDYRDTPPNVLPNQEHFETVLTNIIAEDGNIEKSTYPVEYSAINYLGSSDADSDKTREEASKVFGYKNNHENIDLNTDEEVIGGTNNYENNDHIGKNGYKKETSDKNKFGSSRGDADKHAYKQEVGKQKSKDAVQSVKYRLQHGKEKYDGSNHAKINTFAQKFGGGNKEKERPHSSFANDDQLPQCYGEPQLEVLPACGVEHTPVVMRHTSIQRNLIEVFDTAAEATKVIISTLTNTFVEPNYFTVMNHVTVTANPRVLTTIELISSVVPKTIEKFFTHSKYSFSTLDLYETQIDVVESVIGFTTRTPAYTTTTKWEVEESTIRVIAPATLSSTMTFTEVHYQQIPVTKTGEKNWDLQKTVWDTKFEKVMVTKTETLIETVSVTKECKKSIFQKYKPWS